MPETAEEKKDKTEAAKGPVDIKNMDTKQKAAIVVVSLGADRASQIYKYLNEQDVHHQLYLLWNHRCALLYRVKETPAHTDSLHGRHGYCSRAGTGSVSTGQTHEGRKGRGVLALK